MRTFFVGAFFLCVSVCFVFSCSDGVTKDSEDRGGQETQQSESVQTSEHIEKKQQEPQVQEQAQERNGHKEPAHDSTKPSEPSDTPEADGGVIERVTGQEKTSGEMVVEHDSDSPNSPFTATIVHAHDVVTSYLLSGSSWNYFHGATVRLGRHSNTGHTSYFTAFRFRQIQIPANATITSAFLSFYPHNEVDSSHRLLINIYAEKTADSAPYDPTNYTSNRPDQRSRTKAYVDRWVVRCNDDCSSDINSPKYEYDCPQRKRDCWDRQTLYQVPKDLKGSIQEVVSQPAWQSGNSISVFLFNAATDRDGSKYQDSRTVVGFDESQKNKTPRLVIQYQK